MHHALDLGLDFQLSWSDKTNLKRAPHCGALSRFCLIVLDFSATCRAVRHRWMIHAIPWRSRSTGITWI